MGACSGCLPWVPCRAWLPLVCHTRGGYSREPWLTLPPPRAEHTTRTRRPPRLQATIEWEAQEEGFLAKILAPAGSSNIPVGTPVALIVEEQDQVAAFKDYSPAGGAAGAAASPAAAGSAPKKARGKGGKKEAAAKPASFPAHTVLSMPSLSPTMNQVRACSVYVGMGAGVRVAPASTRAQPSPPPGMPRAHS